MEKKITITHGHPYVEIGGIKWATMNVGAKNATDPGLYFAWGETKGYSREDALNRKKFSRKNYKFWDNNKNYISKYNSKDKLTTLQPQDDPVKVNWRGNWRLPTKDEFLHLINSTNHQFVDNYQGRNARGVVLTDKNNNSLELFMPFSGYVLENYIATSSGFYWTSNLLTGRYNCNYNHGINLYFSNHEFIGTVANDRYIGFTVRGVLDD